MYPPITSLDPLPRREQHEAVDEAAAEVPLADCEPTS
ncbi:hypothetical protein ABH925_000337 [Streptacidiphilus sp. EB129]